jgi:hypothetical protein
MDPKELRGLLEAYSEVYAPQEEIDEAVKGESSERRKDLAAERRAGHKPKSAKEGENYASHKLAQMAYAKRKRMGEEVEEVDEATAMAKRGYDETPIRQKIAKSTGGGEAADRATALADKQVFRGSGSARDNLARKQRGDFRKTTSSSPGLHGYAHKSDDSSVKAKQAARGAQRGVLTPAEKKRLNREEVDIFDVVLEFLQAEGFAETLEEAEWLMANVIDEEAISIVLGEGIPLRGTTPDGKPWRVDPSPVGPRQPRKMERDPKARVSPKGGSRDYKQQSSMKKDSRLEAVEYVDEAQDTTAPRGQSKYGRKAPTGYMQTRKPTLQQMSSREKQAFKDRGIGEEYMDEAQEARNNPEKYEAGEKKKYAPVRGERTPMPPRGNKRREDFEKWYAANVR